MNKKLLFLIFSFTMINTAILYAQSWKVGGNPKADIPKAGGEFGTQTNRDVIFETNNTERARLLGTGFWGFGTSNPNTRVHINGAAGENPFRVQVNGASKLYVDNGGGVSVGSSAIPPANGLYVSGNAGIGTTAPATKLHVFGGSDASPGGGGYIVAGNTNGENIVIDDNEIMARNNGATSALFFNQNGGNVIVNGTNATGNFGIGTSNPTSKLHVIGNIFASGNLDVSGTVGFGSVETLSDGGSNTIQSNSNIVPNADNSWNLGTASRTWASVHALSYLTTLTAGSIATAENLKAGLPEIMRLRPITYTDGSVKKFGLIEKEVQLVLPEATADREFSGDEASGSIVAKTVKLSLEYDALIPVLIKGMQEQQKLIISLQERISQLEAAATSVSSDNMKSSNNLLSGATLEQNQPNPFNQSTIIRYRLPNNTPGQINIYDNNGVLLKSIKANASGQTKLNAGDLRSGTYTYTLSVNGKLAASKKLVIVK